MSLPRTHRLARPLYGITLSLAALSACDQLQGKDAVSLPEGYTFAGAESLSPNADGSYTLSWKDAPVETATYQIFQSLGDSPIDWTAPIRELPSSPFMTDDLRLERQSRCFGVRLVTSAAGSDQNTSILCTTTLFESFQGARTLSLDDSGESILSWDASPLPGVNYEIFKMDGSGKLSTEPLHVTDESTFNLGRLDPFTLSCFVVRAFLPGREAFDVNTRSVCTEETQAARFLGIEGADSREHGSVRLSWTPSENPSIIGYTIYEGTDFKKKLGFSEGRLSDAFELEGLEPFRPLSFGLRALSDLGTEDSNTRTVTTRIYSEKALAFLGLQSLSLENGRDAVLSWPPLANASLFRIYHAVTEPGASPTFDFRRPLAEISGRQSSYDVRGLGDDKEHHFLVRSVSEFDVADQNLKSLSLAIPDAGPPIFGGIRTAFMEDGQAKLTWRPALGQVSEYLVYVARGSASSLDFSSPAQSFVPGNLESTIVSGFKKGEDYTFLVRARDKHGQVEANINTVTLTASMQASPLFHGYIEARGMDERRVRVRFYTGDVTGGSPDPSIGSYEVRVRKAGQRNWLQTVYTSQTLDSIENFADVENLEPVTEYEFLVRSVDRWGNVSTNEFPIPGRTLDMSPPEFSGVRTVEQTPGERDVLVSWEPSGSYDIDHYRVYYSKNSMSDLEFSQDKPPPPTVLVTDRIPASQSSYAFSSLLKGQTYYFVARAFDALGNEDSNLFQASFVVQNSFPSLEADSVAGITPERVAMPEIRLLASDPDIGDPLDIIIKGSTCDTSKAPFDFEIGQRQGKTRSAILRWTPPQDYIPADESDRSCTITFASKDFLQVCEDKEFCGESPVVTLTLSAINRPPFEVSAIVPEPGEGFSRGQAFTCLADAADDDGNPIFFTYRWLKNGNAIDGLTTQDVAAGQIPLAPNDSLVCEATAFDGHDPVTQLSEPVVFGNWQPEDLVIDLQEVSGAPPLLTDDILQCRWQASDRDLDPLIFGPADVEVSVGGVTWQKAGFDNVACPSASTQAQCFRVKASATGAQVRCALASLSDGVVTLTEGLVSPPLSVLNSNPEIRSVTLMQDGSSLERGDTLTCVADVADRDGDALLPPQWIWYRGGALVPGATSPTYTVDLDDRGQDIQCGAFLPQNADGKGSDAQGPGFSGAKRYSNSNPTVEVVAISPSAAIVDTLLTCGFQATDIDGDALNLSDSFVRYFWYVSDGTINAEILGAQSETYRVTAADRGKSITCRVLILDNADGFASLPVGPVVSANAVTPQNSPPIVTSVSVSSNTQPAVRGSTLSCQYAFNDPDGDTLVKSPSYEWRIDGFVIKNQLKSTYSVVRTDRFQEITCGVAFPADADGRSSPATERVYSLTGITPANQDPELEGVAVFAGATPPHYPGRIFTCSAQKLVDPDLDPLTVSYAWFRDGITLPGEIAESYTSTQADRDTIISCSMSLQNGDNFGSAPVTVHSGNSELISNRAPLANFEPTLDITSGRSQLFRDEVLKCNIPAGSLADPVDPDGDLVSIHYLWFLEAEPFPGTDSTGTASDTLDLAGIPQILQSVRCRVRIDDGVAISFSSTSEPQTIVNQAPRISENPVLLTNPIKNSELTNSLQCSEPEAADPDGGTLLRQYAFAYQRAGSQASSFTFFRRNTGGETWSESPILEANASVSWKAGDRLRCSLRVSDDGGLVALLDSEVATVENSPPLGTFSCNNGESTLIANPGSSFTATTACDKTQVIDPDGDILNFVFDDVASTCPGLGSSLLLTSGGGSLSGIAPSSPCRVRIVLTDPSGERATNEGTPQHVDFDFTIPFTMAIGEPSLDSSCELSLPTSFSAGLATPSGSSFQFSELAGTPQSHTDPLTSSGLLQSLLSPSSAGSLLVEWTVTATEARYSRTISKSLVLENSPDVGSSDLLSPQEGLQPRVLRGPDGLESGGCATGACEGQTGVIAAGPRHSCAVADGGELYCFGDNTQGQLGIGSIGHVAPWEGRPLLVSGLELYHVRGLALGGNSISGTDFSCASLELKSDSGSRSVGCWGDNSQGQLGRGLIPSGAPFESPLMEPIAVPVDPDTSAHNRLIAVAAGDSHACALSDEASPGSGGRLLCWGRNNRGQLGDETTVSRGTPQPVHGFENGGAIAIAAGANHSCALKTDQSIVCWGDNDRYQLGFVSPDVANPYATKPAAILGLSQVSSLAAGSKHTCALKTSGEVKCWGSREFSQAGGGTGFAHSSPAPALGGLISDGIAIAAGANHTCALRRSGGMSCWGQNANSQLGVGSALAIEGSPKTVQNTANAVIAIAGGRAHTCLLTNSGQVRCFGSNVYKQLGINEQQQIPSNSTLPNPLTTPAIPRAQYESCPVLRVYASE